MPTGAGKSVCYQVPAMMLPEITVVIDKFIREQKALQNSWAKIFAEEIFPKINEKPFSVLYSEYHIPAFEK